MFFRGGVGVLIRSFQTALGITVLATMTKIKFIYKGLIVPVFTPLNNDEDQSLNVAMVPNYARFLESKKITGILVNGSTGEGTLLTVDERKRISEAWADAVKETKQHLMIQVGGGCLKDVKELAAHAESIGADSILCLPELYFKPTTPKDLVDYLKLVAESAPKTPILYYDYPRATGVNVDMKQFFELAVTKIPTFAGTKTDIERGLQARQVNKNHAIFLAGDMLMISGCATGMESYIMTTLNFLSEPALEILEFAKGKSSLEIARKSQDYINKIITEITQYGSWVETMKVAMSLTTNLFMGPPRAPLKLLSQENVEAMNKGLTKLGIKTNKIAIYEMF